MNRLLAKIPALLLTVVVGLIASSSAFATATIVILNNDAAGVGFNDTTPATPVGGNTGTTVGQQRLIAFQAAADIWGATLTSGPTIVIRAQWAALTCTAQSGTLGSAGNSGSIWRNFTNSVPNFWYGNALANALTNSDMNGAVHEINATFNVNLGTPGCLETLHWYYGLDNNHGSTGEDLVSVLLHEFGHGLGFQTFTSSTSGVQQGGFPSIYDRFLFDKTQGKTWADPAMTDALRQASAINTGNLVWNGPQVMGDAPGVLSGTPRLRVNSPPGIAGNYAVGTASFGPALSSPGVTGDVAQAIPADGCSAIGGAVSGKIALINRGTCTFVVKVKNAQDAGAIGVVIVNNVAGSPPPGMSGTDPTITIPAVMITDTDGVIINGQLGGGVNATLLADPSALAGADSLGRPLLFTPNPIQGGSSVSHWDTTLLPNQLMEPSINGDLSHSVITPQDLTFSLMKDIGWCAGCPQPPPPSPTPTPSPPPNDNFASAQVISGCSGSVTGTNFGATEEAGEPNHPESPGSTRSVWYQWQAPSTENVTIDTIGSNFDTLLAVYTGTTVSGLTLVASNDDIASGNIASTVTFAATQGTVYRIAVDGFNNSGSLGDTGNITLNWTESNCSQSKTDQTITFAALSNKTYLDPPFAVSASASSGLPVSFSVLSGPATISGNTITITGAGPVTVRASQAGDANYNAATPVDQSFTVNKANQTITFNALADRSFGDAPFNVSATTSSSLPVSFIIVSGPATISGNTITITGVGVVTVRASQAGDANYNAATPVDQSFTVNKANQTITFNALADRSFGDAPFNVSATASSSLPVIFSIVSGPATISGNTITITGVGVVTVRASQAGDANYNPATSVDRSFTVNKANQTITFNPLPAKTYGDALFNVSATASSGLPVSFSIFSGPATIAGATITLTGAGTVTVRASQAGNSNYNAAVPINQPFTVSKANQTISFGLLPSKTFGDAPFSLSATSSSGLAVSFQILSGPATISGNTVSITGPGTVTVRATQAGNTNYNAASSVDQPFDVVSAAANISLTNLAQTYDGSAKFATATTTPQNLNVSITYSQNGSPVSSPTNSGAYNVTATITSPGFNGTTTGTLVINKATPVITWNDPANIPFGTALSSAQLNATSNVSGNFLYNALPGTVLGAGTYQLSVIFFPSDLSNYNTAAASVQLTVDFPIALLLELGTNRAAAVDSVTLLRGPFPIIGTHNFSADQHTRVIIFTSNLLLSQPVPALSVQVRDASFNTYALTVENVGTVTSVAGLDASYIVVRLPDGLPSGDLSLTVIFSGLTSNTALIGISP